MGDYAIIKTNGMDAEELARFKMSEFEHMLLQVKGRIGEDREICDVCSRLYLTIERLIDGIEEAKVKDYWNGEKGQKKISHFEGYKQIQDGKNESGLFAGDRRI